MEMGIREYMVYALDKIEQEQNPFPDDFYVNEQYDYSVKTKSSSVPLYYNDVTIPEVQDHEERKIQVEDISNQFANIQISSQKNYDESNMITNKEFDMTIEEQRVFDNFSQLPPIQSVFSAMNYSPNWNDNWLNGESSSNSYTLSVSSHSTSKSEAMFQQMHLNTDNHEDITHHHSHHHHYLHVHVKERLQKDSSVEKNIHKLIAEGLGLYAKDHPELLRNVIKGQFLNLQESDLSVLLENVLKYFQKYFCGEKKYVTSYKKVCKFFYPEDHDSDMKKYVKNIALAWARYYLRGDIFLRERVEKSKKMKEESKEYIRKNFEELKYAFLNPHKYLKDSTDY